MYEAGLLSSNEFKEFFDKIGKSFHRICDRVIPMIAIDVQSNVADEGKKCVGILMRSLRCIFLKNNIFCSMSIVLHLPMKSHNLGMNARQCLDRGNKPMSARQFLTIPHSPTFDFEYGLYTAPTLGISGGNICPHRAASILCPSFALFTGFCTSV